MLQHTQAPSILLVVSLMIVTHVCAESICGSGKPALGDREESLMEAFDRSPMGDREGWKLKKDEAGIKVYVRKTGVSPIFTWYAFDRLFRAEVDYTIVSGPLAENWSTADGVYPGDYGTIEGDLGTWQYLWRGDQMTTDPCNRRIVVDNGTLTAYECHHEVGGYGFGKVWVWLDNFHGAQAFYPLNHVFWNFSSSGEFGPDGYAYFYVGQLYSDMHAATGGGALSPAGSDFMAIRPPKNVNPEAAGSMYFGAILYSNYHEEDPDFSMAQMTLSGIEIEPYDAEIQVFPPDDYGPFTEDFRGITETYRPLVIEVWPFLTLEGFVSIPGTFGRWGAHFYSTQYNTNPCDTRVEVDNGQVVVHSCHHEYLGGGQGYARFQLESLYMDVPYFDMTNITWDLDHTAPGGSATDVLSIGISGFGRWDSPGGVDPGSLNLDPIRKLILVGDGTMWPDFAFKSRVAWTEAPQEVNEFQINVNEVIITGVPPEGAEGQGEQQLFTYDGYPIPNFSLADHKESEESLK